MIVMSGCGDSVANVFTAVIVHLSSEYDERDDQLCQPDAETRSDRGLR